MSGSGSGKKRKDKGPTWFDCSKCHRRFTRQSVTRHHELNCGIVYPFMEGTALFVNLNKLSKNSPLEIRRLPFLSNNRYASGVIFISHTLILECSLEAFGWVTVSAIGKNKDGNLVQVDNSKGYALLVWPIFEEPGNQPYLSLMTENGFKINSMLSSKIDEMCCVKVERLSFSYSLPIFLSAAEITVEIENNAFDGVNVDLERFTQTVREFIIGRIVCLQNRFQVRVFTEMIPIIITNIKVMNSAPSSSTIEITDLSALRISGPHEQTVEDFYEITDKTLVNIVENGKGATSDANIIAIHDVGGLETAIKDAQSTIEFFLSSRQTGGEVPKALLFYGHTGTGKSMLVKALCSHYYLNIIFFDGLARSKTDNRYSVRNSLTKAINEAILRAPAVVVIENIDAYSLKKQNSSQQENVNFANTLRSCVESLSNASKVILLATTSDIDSVDPDLRSHRIFGKEIEITIPSAPEREDILNKLIRKVKHTLTSEDVKSIAGITHGFVGADLNGLCSQAKMLAIQRELQGQLTSAESLVINVSVSFQDFQECIKWVKPSAMRSILVDVPNVRWSDIGGQTDLKFKLKQAIEWPLKHPDAFQRLGIKPPKGILMYGPPGCSKTMIAKAIATESGLNFISVKGSELFSKWVGESEKAVQTLFRKARQVSPSVVFFDEIDSLGGERGSTSGSSNVHERVLAQLLVEIDGIVPLKDVTIVAATNRPDIIDPALLRPGRLDRIIYVPMPDAETREDILKVRFKKMPVDSQVNLERLVQLTEGYSGAEVTAVCHEAALKALEENIEAALICDKHFLTALEVVRPRISAEQISFYENYHKSRKM